MLKQTNESWTLYSRKKKMELEKEEKLKELEFKLKKLEFDKEQKSK